MHQDSKRFNHKLATDSGKHMQKSNNNLLYICEGMLSFHCEICVQWGTDGRGQPYTLGD